MKDNKTKVHEKLLGEIERVPVEYLSALLTIAHSFRESVAFDSAENSFEKGWKEAIKNDCKPIDDLWKGLEH